MKPPDWETNWDDAPLPYKLYRRLPGMPLPADVPLTLAGKETPGKPNVRNVGHFLWYVYGLAQVSQSVFVPDRREEPAGPVHLYRRFAPSGGGLYPNEMYIYLKLEDLPAGVYHYDAAHHRLVLLREGHFDSYLGKALGNRCDLADCFGVVLVTSMFWKNFFKYNNFSYRLQGLDAGVLLGQLLEVSKRFGFEPCVYFQFVDRAVNHLLGLSEQEESVYAVIPLSAEPKTNWFANLDESESGGKMSAPELCKELEAVRHDHYVRSMNVVDYPMLIKLNEASMQNSAGMFRPLEREEGGGTCKRDAVKLPAADRLSYDLAAVSRMRFSPETNFVLRQVSLLDLAALLQETTASFSYRNDLDGTERNAAARVSLYGCFYGVEGIDDGAYRYDAAAHALEPVRPGDCRSWLQYGMSLHNLNLFQIPLCFHVAADRNHLGPQLGYRGYRIQQMEAGMLVQRLLLAAFALGMGGHPLLGYDAKSADELYGLASDGKTALIQIPVGPYRARSRLEGGLSQ